MEVEVIRVVADHGSVVQFLTTDNTIVTVPHQVAQVLVDEIEEHGIAVYEEESY